ncbi:sigma-70 family RNA polymerase sigma factor [Jeotgalibacillus sp. ET6]|uniref:sigma-70 family RNA polymerase sigma factor n=1 Tax=Jeotgalibacillus sp. ET6 TaxID=3037260 RepID=UPI00241844A7|nr:sigma-70 family RNA polymerase sigma factor [Jeotgalibacillus sp. ET6]MDG5473250.1 sigma-70 family RNA polymerase sigma factor [Jeotgalibacillus sp. ET6]
MAKGDVVQKAITGDDTAFLQVIHLYKIDLYKTALAFLKDEEEALEAVQEVTYRAYKSIRSLKNPAYIKTWLIRIMINYCQDEQKKHKQMVFHDDKINQIAAADDYSFFELEDAMQMLEDNERELLHLKYFSDLKIKDIAALWNRPEGTIKTWLTKALAKLKEHMTEEGGKRRVSK